jgi:hypothetical protein
MHGPSARAQAVDVLQLKQGSILGHLSILAAAPYPRQHLPVKISHSLARNVIE